MKKILLIEDDRDILDLMACILNDEGYEVIAAQDSSPLKQLLVLQPDLILMDNRLTDGLGRDHCRQIKMNPATAHIPVVLVSANTDLEAMVADSLANGCLSKPFDVDELIALTRRFSNSAQTI